MSILKSKCNIGVSFATYCALLSLCLVDCYVPPDNCDSNGCTIGSFIGVWPDRIPCKLARVIYPTTEQEIIDAVADAVKNNVKIKAASKGRHSMGRLMCPGGERGILISTRDYTANIIVDEASRTVTADSGVQLGDLINAVAKHGLALVHTPYWAGVSIAGLLGTGAHGSSIWGKGSAVHEYVVGMTLVVPASAEEGYAKVVSVKEGDEDLNAAKVSLGLLGVVSQVTLQLEPMFKRSITHKLMNDSNIEDDLFSFAKAHEFADITWYPALAQAVYKMDDRVPLDTPGDGRGDLPLMQPLPAAVVSAFRKREELWEAERDVEAKCGAERDSIAYFFLTAAGLTNNGTHFEGYPVVGRHNLLQTTGGSENPPEGFHYGWDPRNKGLFFHNMAFSISFANVKGFIRDIKKLQEANPRSFCGFSSYGGIMVRFIGQSSAYLGKKEDVVDFDFFYYRSFEFENPRLNQDVIDEIEQLAYFKYDGSPHFGKNRNLAFEGLPQKTPQLSKFLEVKNRLDPQGLFSNEWTDAVLGIAGREGSAPTSISIFQDYCALDGWCICSHDRHCAPEKGYFCRPGIVYQDARVCRYEASSILGTPILPVHPGYDDTINGVRNEDLNNVDSM